ncbi:MAG: hypothetical protein RBT63_01765 [Bdellovibrionales bacterium]|nr:hypothetical protein [Bdellovibrionales bacterium]
MKIRLQLILILLGVGVLPQASLTQENQRVRPAAGAREEAKLPGPISLPSEFVTKYRALLNSKTEIAYDTKPPSDLTGSAQEELRLLAAELLVKRGYTLSAQVVFMDVAARAIGTSQGAWALYALDQLAQSYEIDDSAMEEMAYEYDGTIDRVSESSMISWYRAKALLRRGYTDWALRDLNKVAATTRWHADRLFDRATEFVADGKVKEAEEIYDDLIKRTEVRVPTKQFSELNRARLVFERGDYREILAIVKKLDLPIREQARAILEMAWSRYYMREYSKALGLLKVVDSAFFSSLRAPEVDLLRMVIERDLCRYDLVTESAKAFRERYDASFKRIESRLNLEAESQLKQMALQGRALQRRAMLIHRYRTERRVIEDEDIKMVPGLRDVILKAIVVREKKAEGEIARLMPRAIEDVASQLISLREQVTFLEYESKIRPLTTSPVEDMDYRPESASKTRFDKLYWPIINEAWWDELENYTVLLRARCAEPLPVGMEYSRKPQSKQDSLDDEDDDYFDDEDDE